MAVDTLTANLLQSVLAAPAVLRVFTAIASRRIATKSSLVEAGAQTVEALERLRQADLIDVSTDRERYFVTAKGLKVARDLSKLPLVCQ